MEPFCRVSMISKPRAPSDSGRSWVSTTLGSIFPADSATSSSGM
jgi:hypothetical protein